MNWLNAIHDLQLPPLRAGGHDTPQNGLCAMEMVAYMERLPHSDAPSCTCPVIAAFVRSVNDDLPHDARQALMPVLSELVGTVSVAHEFERVQYLLRRMRTRWAPVVLRDAGVSRSVIASIRDAQTFTDMCDAALWVMVETRDARAARVAAGIYNVAHRLRDDIKTYGVLGSLCGRVAVLVGADECIASIRGALAIGPRATGFQSMDTLPELAALA